jgi:taurine transport system substrate-binding protein
MARKWPILVIFIVLVAVGCNRNGQAKYPSVKIGQQVWPSMNILSQSEGFDQEEFSKLGTSVEYTYIESGPAMQAAISSGKIDIGIVGGVRFVSAVAAGIPVKLIWISDAIDSAEGLVVRKGVTKVEELRGKKIATPFASISHFGLLATLELYGVKQSEVQIIDISPSDTVAAFQRGDVDAVFVWDPNFSKLTELGGVKLFTLGDLNKATGGKRAAMDLVFARADFIRKYPALVEAYVMSLDRATKLYQSDPDKAAASMKKLMGLESTEETKRQTAGLLFSTADQHLERNWEERGADVFFAIGQFLKQQGQLDKAPTREEIVGAMDFTFIEKVAGK